MNPLKMAKVFNIMPKGRTFATSGHTERASLTLFLIQLSNRRRKWNVIRQKIDVGAVDVTKKSNAVIGDFNWNIIFLKYGPKPASFCLFSSLPQYNDECNNKKQKWWAWDSNSGPQDGRCRRIHIAMAASLIETLFTVLNRQPKKAKISHNNKASYGPMEARLRSPRLTNLQVRINITPGLLVLNIFPQSIWRLIGLTQTLGTRSLQIGCFRR